MRQNVLILVLSFSLLGSCGVQHTYSAFMNWDSNDDRILQRDEFVDMYLQSEYFKKWSDTQDPVRYEVIHQNIFKTLDRDSSKTIDNREYYSFNNFYSQATKFTEWDDDQNGGIDRGEFNRHICKNGLLTAWDANADLLISKIEMGEGMFHVCDVNQNGIVDEPEFNVWNWFRRD